MLRSAKDLIGYEAIATDGAIGVVRDLYLDEGNWCLCYLVVETRKRPRQYSVLITPTSIEQARWVTRRVRLSLTRQQVLDSVPSHVGANPGRQLRSVRELIGYGIEAVDGKAGCVRDFLLDDDTWLARFVVVGPCWLPGRSVGIAADAITEMNCVDRKVAVRRTRAQLRGAREHDDVVYIPDRKLTIRSGSRD